ncbi:hypothetical protein CTAYLR_003976 [Chrysophaeum taylorii]|uniref:Uncharacterized protein n=1 Tax=Chrysophaeum taylorii TaxID=2483200 RepID=A0AAD7UGH5_9STRA|nr:hypothetical protein CTAYLR_003976 [Chrysophaeum taylorii]
MMMMLLGQMITFCVAAAHDVSFVYDLESSYAYDEYDSRTRAYVMRIPETEADGPQTLLYELSGSLRKQSFLRLDVILYEETKCEADAFAVVENCEVAMSSADVLSTAGPCDIRSYDGTAKQAIIPSLIYDRANDLFVRDIDNHYVNIDRSMSPDTNAAKLKFKGYDTFVRAPREACD